MLCCWNLPSPRKWIRPAISKQSFEIIFLMFKHPPAGRRSAAAAAGASAGPGAAAAAGGGGMHSELRSVAAQAGSLALVFICRMLSSISARSMMVLVGVVGIAVAIPHKVIILGESTFGFLCFLLLEFLLQERKDRSAVDNPRLQLCDCGIEGVCCNCRRLKTESVKKKEKQLRGL